MTLHWRTGLQLWARALGQYRREFFFLMRRSHSIGFTKAQGIPKYKIGFGRGKGWEGWGYLAWPLCWPLVSSKIGGRWE
jgi:hypothetical protein